MDYINKSGTGKIFSMVKTNVWLDCIMWMDIFVWLDKDEREVLKYILKTQVTYMLTGLIVGLTLGFF